MTEGKVTATTTNSITVTAKAKDGDPTADKPGEQSGIAKIKFEITGQIGGTKKTVSEEKTVTITKPSDTAEAECIFTGLTQTQSYTITATAIDKAGNVSTNAIAITGGSTGTVPGGNKEGNSGAIDFAYASESTVGTEGWTKGPVNVTITSTYTGQGYKLQYTTQATTENDWHDYSGPVKMTTNGTIYARLKDSTDQTGATATGQVANIDTVLPNEFIPSISDIKPTSFTITVSAKDTPSGVDYYDYYVDGKLYAEKSKSTSCNVVNQKDGMKHTVYVNAVDKAGNIRKSGDAEANLPVANVPPVIASVQVQSKTPNSLTIRANATDADAADATGLTFKVYIETDTNKKAEATGKAQGTDVDLTISGLAEYTNYKYTVEVTDTAQHTVKSIGNDGKTQCSGTTQTCSNYKPAYTCPGGSLGTYCPGGTRGYSMYCHACGR